jgi:hypothetical protein
MRTPTIAIMILALMVASIAFWGCSGSVGIKTSTPVVVETKAPGPPPHAPAHGYRHKHPDGVVLVYDAGLGLYVVNGHADVYFCEGTYYRAHHGAWESTKHFHGNWKKASSKSLPAGLQNKQVAKGGKEKKK